MDNCRDATDDADVEKRASVDLSGGLLPVTASFHYKSNLLASTSSAICQCRLRQLFELDILLSVGGRMGGA